jgi:hypothetical protein
MNLHTKVQQVSVFMQSYAILPIRCQFDQSASYRSCLRTWQIRDFVAEVTSAQAVRFLSVHDLVQAGVPNQE